MKRVIWLGLALGCLACGGADQSSLLGDGGNAADEGIGTDVTVPPQDSGPPTKDVVTVDVPIADVVVPDSPVGPPDSLIHCGSALTCDAKTQICCKHTFSSQQYQCVSSVNDCMGNGDVPIECSSNDNCVSQGNPGYICCADANNAGTGNCTNYTVASSVSCQADCSQQGQVPVGCSQQVQDCPYPNQTCIVSICTLPGYTICN